MEHTIADVEARRLEQLQLQAATYGPHTDPAVLIEIQDLTRGKRSRYNPERRQLVSNLDYDFLMNVVAAALVRLGSVEKTLAHRATSRDIWMIVITIMVFLSLVLQLIRS